MILPGALQVLDLLVGACIEEGPRTAPPSAPGQGACYIIGPAPTGAWAGKAQYLAGFTSGGWRFITPIEGMNAVVRSTGVQARYRGGAWELVGPRQPAIVAPSGGTTVDVQSRTAIGQILSALRQHGLIDP